MFGKKKVGVGLNPTELWGSDIPGFRLSGSGGRELASGSHLPFNLGGRTAVN